VVGRDGLEPSTSAVIGLERSATEGAESHETAGVIRLGGAAEALDSATLGSTGVARTDSIPRVTPAGSLRWYWHEARVHPVHGRLGWPGHRRGLRSRDLWHEPGESYRERFKSVPECISESGIDTDAYRPGLSVSFAVAEFRFCHVLLQPDHLSVPYFVAAPAALSRRFYLLAVQP
jgi:hypothetical protein